MKLSTLLINIVGSLLIVGTANARDWSQAYGYSNNPPKRAIVDAEEQYFQVQRLENRMDNVESVVVEQDGRIGHLEREQHRTNQRLNALEFDVSALRSEVRYIRNAYYNYYYYPCYLGVYTNLATDAGIMYSPYWSTGNQMGTLYAGTQVRIVEGGLYLWSNYPNEHAVKVRVITGHLAGTVGFIELRRINAAACGYPYGY